MSASANDLDLPVEDFAINLGLDPLGTVKVVASQRCGMILKFLRSCFFSSSP